jgi:hypothetical protein
MEYKLDLRPEYDSVPTFPAVIICVSDGSPLCLVAEAEFPDHPELGEVGPFTVELCGEQLDRVALSYWELNPGEHDHLPVPSAIKGVFAELVSNHKGDLLRLRTMLVRERSQRRKEESSGTVYSFYKGQMHEMLGVLQQMRGILRFSKPVLEANDPTKVVGLELVNNVWSSGDVVPKLIDLLMRCHDAVQNVIAHLDFVGRGGSEGKLKMPSTTPPAPATEAEAPIEATGAVEWLEAALHALADDVADPAVEDATRLQGLFSSFCDQLRADEPDPEELYADLRGVVEVLPRLEDRTLEALDRMDRVLKMVARLD